MEANNNSLIPWLVLGIIIVFGIITIWPEASIADEVEEEYTLVTRRDDFEAYSTVDDVSQVVTEISSLEEPYDQEINPGEKSVMLYPEYAVVLLPKKDGTRIEILEHDDAYEHHHSIIHSHWGSLRNGSIGNAPARGGGFGFGK